MTRTLVLDLDGTLVDTVPDLLASLNRLMAARAFAPFGAAAVTAMIGDGAAVLVQRAMAARAREASASDISDFLADYGAHPAVDSRPFPGVAATLPTLRDAGWRLAVCTNKPERPARALLAALDLLAFFDAVGGGDSFPVRKPNPAHLLATIEAAGGDPAASVMVGDHRNDIQAAAGARVPCVFALWGYGPAAMAEGAAAQAERFADVPDIIGRLLGAA